VEGRAKEKGSDDFWVGGNGGIGGGTEKEDTEHVPPHPSTQRLCSKPKRGTSGGLDRAYVTVRQRGSNNDKNKQALSVSLFGGDNLIREI